MAQVLDLLEVRRYALDANVDPRTLVKEVRTPGSVRGAAGVRIRRVLSERGKLRDAMPAAVASPSKLQA